jgi:hypothetical protein
VSCTAASIFDILDDPINSYWTDRDKTMNQELTNEGCEIPKIYPDETRQTLLVVSTGPFLHIWTKNFPYTSECMTSSNSVDLIGPPEAIGFFCICSLIYFTEKHKEWESVI